MRVITAGNAILQKCHTFEVMLDLQNTAAAWSETQQVDTLMFVGFFYLQMSSLLTDCHHSGQEDMEEAESPMEEEPALNSSPVSEAELDRLAGVLEEIHHLLETAPHCMVQPPGKAFPTSARITGPQEKDDPYPTLFRYRLTQ